VIWQQWSSRQGKYSQQSNSLEEAAAGAAAKQAATGEAAPGAGSSGAAAMGTLEKLSPTIGVDP